LFRFGTIKGPLNGAEKRRFKRAKNTEEMACLSLSCFSSEPFKGQITGDEIDATKRLSGVDFGTT